MIRALRSYFSYAKPIRSDAETLNQMNMEISDDITVIGSYSGFNNDASLYNVKARCPPTVMEGDTLLILVASELEIPRLDKFKTILTASDKSGRMAMTLGYKVWNNADDMSFNMPDYYGDLFVNLITLKGTRFIVDARARVSSNCSTDDSIIAPRVKTMGKGAIISAFSYEEPSNVYIPGSKSLASLENGHKGISVGISPSSGGTSHRVRAYSNGGKCGMGDDIAFSISII